MKKLVFAVMVLGTAVSYAAKNTKQMSEAERIAQYEEAILEEGGMVQVSGKGAVVAYDMRKVPALDDIRSSWKELAEQLKIGFVAKAGTGKFSIENVGSLMKQAGGEAVVFIVEDPALPITLAAQEARWSVLNVTPLKEGNPAPEVFGKRFTIGFLRAAVRAIGSDISRFESSLLNVANDAKDFDGFKGQDLTFDTQMGILTYVPKIGIDPVEFATYKTACEDGLSIPPTNDVQRAIWKKYQEQKQQKK